MPIKKFRPYTPSRRGMSTLTFEELTRSKPEKSLTTSIKRHAGHNNQGCITSWHRGGGHKKLYRIIDFKQTDRLGVPGTVTSIEYDPYRTCFIMLVTYADGAKRYHIAPEGITVDTTIITKEKAKAKLGNRMMLKNIPVGFEIYNIELTKGHGGQIVRTAGAKAKLVSLEGKYAQIQLPSKEVRFAHKDCFASVGGVSNIDHSNINLGKAGRNRFKGWRPHVRGKAKNPVDHPHGGGEGCNPIGMPSPKTPWGVPTLGFKTRRRKNPTSKWIVRTRKGKQLIKTD